LLRPPAFEGWALKYPNARCQNSAGAVTRHELRLQPLLI